MNRKFANNFRINELLLISSKYWNVSVRPKQLTLGSLVVSLKRDCSSFGALSFSEISDLSILIPKIEQLLKSAFSFDKINYLGLMMVDNHVHFHVIPRYSKSITFREREYYDFSWPEIYDINKTIEEKGIENEVYEYLKKFLNKVEVIKGYTTGVFDLFHVGHLNILRRAKQFCDYLIVGVTTDELSYIRKGKKPVISLEERMEIVKSVRYVDEVVVQDNMDKILAWEKFKFHKMFVGSDWKGTRKWNDLERIFSRKGVEIIYFPYTKSTSSTMLRQVLKSKLDFKTE